MVLRHPAIAHACVHPDSVLSQTFFIHYSFNEVNASMYLTCPMSFVQSNLFLLRAALLVSVQVTWLHLTPASFVFPSSNLRLGSFFYRHFDMARLASRDFIHSCVCLSLA